MLPAVPIGYHELTFAAGDCFWRTLIIAAPTQSYSEPGHKPVWGTFLPMYAARSDTDWGAGNFATWGKLVDWVADNGARVVACLPLLASFLENPVCEPSPYSPASRLFWNDFYVDVASEVEQCPAARKLAASLAFREKISKFRNAEMIDYREQASERRKILELLATCFFSKPSARRNQLTSSCAAGRTWRIIQPFERHATAPKRVGRAGRKECGTETSALRITAVRATHARVCAMDGPAAGGRAAGAVREKEDAFLFGPSAGVHPDGYDVWRHRDNFALLANAGAPPDTFFTKGQDWGFSPLHPQHLRRMVTNIC